MKFALVLEWFGFETGLWLGGSGEPKWKIVKFEVVILTVGIQFTIGI